MTTPHTQVEKHPVFARWERWDYGARQRRNSDWAARFVADPKMSDVRVCIELVFGDDYIVRVSSGGITTTSNIDGKTYVWHPVLESEPEISESYEIGSSQASARSLSVTLPRLVAGSPLVPVSTLLASGRAIGGFAEISLAYDGLDYDSRLVVLRGSASVSFGADGQSVGVKISDVRESVAFELPPVVADDIRLTQIAESAVGKRYPIVINRYTHIPTLRAIDAFGGNGLVFMAAEGPDVWDVDAVYLASAVYAEGTLQAGARYTAVSKVDARGQTYFGIDYTFADIADDATIYVTLDRADGVYQDVITVVEDLLSQGTGLGIGALNRVMFGLAKARMPNTVPRVLINASGEKATTAIEVAESILESFPMVSLAFEGAGLGTIVTDRRVGPMEHEAVLTGGTEPLFPLIKRVGGPVETPSNELFTRFELRYGYNPILDQFASVGVRDDTNTVACSRVRQSVGFAHPMTPIESPYIFDDADANYVLDWLVAHHATPSYWFEWECFPWAYWLFRRGQVVRYTDAEFGLTSVVATVMSLRYRRGRCDLGLRVWHPTWGSFTGAQ